MAIINLSKNTLLAAKVVVADKFYARLKGLLGRDYLKKQEALVIKPTKSIHTFFMRFAIDVVFVNKENKVVALREHLKPFRLTPIFPDALLVIELPANAVKETHTQTGDNLKIEI